MKKTEIKKIAKDIKSFLDEHFLNGDCRIYFNGMCWSHGEGDDPFTWDEEKKDFIDVPHRTEWKTIEDIDPKDYFDYVGPILSMSFEGGFYDVMNGWSERDFKLQDEFSKMLAKYGVYSELGNAWNLSLYEA